ncbi:hypothetical protein Bbelb_401590 [Branchiostoma belcheri]|nr:hypothetical protein Bbelb_401590 [Branchiostoma belcheri]
MRLQGTGAAVRTGECSGKPAQRRHKSRAARAPVARSFLDGALLRPSRSAALRDNFRASGDRPMRDFRAGGLRSLRQSRPEVSTCVFTCLTSGKTLHRSGFASRGFTANPGSGVEAGGKRLYQHLRRWRHLHAALVCRPVNETGAGVDDIGRISPPSSAEPK